VIETGASGRDGHRSEASRHRRSLGVKTTTTVMGNGRDSKDNASSPRRSLTSLTSRGADPRIRKRNAEKTTIRALQRVE